MTDAEDLDDQHILFNARELKDGIWLERILSQIRRSMCGMGVQNRKLFDVLGRFARVVTFDVSVKNTIEVLLSQPQIDRHCQRIFLPDLRHAALR